MVDPNEELQIYSDYCVSTVQSFVVVSIVQD